MHFRWYWCTSDFRRDGLMLLHAARRIPINVQNISRHDSWFRGYITIACYSVIFESLWVNSGDFTSCWLVCYFPQPWIWTLFRSTSPLQLQCVPIKRKPVLSVGYLHCHEGFNQTIYFIIKGIFYSFILIPNTWYLIAWLKRNNLNSCMSKLICAE